MVAGQPRKPTALLKLHGQYREDRHGDRRSEPFPDGDPLEVGPMTDAVRSTWERWTGQLSQVCTSWDSEALYAMARYWVLYCRMFDQSEKRRNLPDRKQLARLNEVWREVSRLLGKFGMTPADRAAIQRKPSKPKDEDDFESLLA